VAFHFSYILIQKKKNTSAARASHNKPAPTFVIFSPLVHFVFETNPPPHGVLSTQQA
jgi:hypothetical protein